MRSFTSAVILLMVGSINAAAIPNGGEYYPEPTPTPTPTPTPSPTPAYGWPVVSTPAVGGSSAPATTPSSPADSTAGAPPTASGDGNGGLGQQVYCIQPAGSTGSAAPSASGLVAIPIGVNIPIGITCNNVGITALDGALKNVPILSGILGSVTNA